MLFVLPAADDGLPPPPLPEPLPICEPGSGYQSTDVIRELPYDYCTLLENVLDVGHLPYTHHISVSNRKNGGPLGLALTTPVAFGGFAGVWAQGPRKGALGPQTTVFRAPSLMWHSIESKAISSATVVYATPVAPGRSLIFARFPFKFESPVPRLVFALLPTWLSHLTSTNVVLEDDVVLLAAQERALAERAARGASFAQACYLPHPMDAFTTAFRKWLADFGGGGPFTPAQLLARAPPSPEACLERLSSHTQRCAACRAALPRVRAARALAAAGALAGAALGLALLAIAAGAGGGGAPAATALPRAAACAAAAAACGAAWRVADGLLQKFYRGDRVPPRNRLVERRAAGGAGAGAAAAPAAAPAAAGGPR